MEAIGDTTANPDSPFAPQILVHWSEDAYIAIQSPACELKILAEPCDKQGGTPRRFVHSAIRTFGFRRGGSCVNLIGIRRIGGLNPQHHVNTTGCQVTVICD